MAYTPQQLMDASKCLNCIPPGMQDAVIIYLLCQLAQGAGLSGGVLCGVVDPTTAPSGNCGFYTNTATGSVWYWDAPNAQWVKFIGP